ncbi:MAG: heavy-metal-associated domain-containing protein [Candidatus Scalindua sp.]
MFTNKYLNLGYLSVISVVFVIAMTVSSGLVYAGPEDEVEVVLNVEGMTCGACEDVVRSQLLKVDGVKDASADCKKDKAVVKVEGGKANIDELIQAVEKAGFSASKS